MCREYARVAVVVSLLLLGIASATSSSTTRSSTTTSFSSAAPRVPVVVVVLIAVAVVHAQHASHEIPEEAQGSSFGAGGDALHGGGIGTIFTAMILSRGSGVPLIAILMMMIFNTIVTIIVVGQQVVALHIQTAVQHPAQDHHARVIVQRNCGAGGKHKDAARVPPRSFSDVQIPHGIVAVVEGGAGED